MSCYEIGCFSSWQLDDIISLFCCLTTKSLDVERNFLTPYSKFSSGNGVDWLWHDITWWFVVIGALPDRNAPITTNHHDT